MKRIVFIIVVMAFISSSCRNNPYRVDINDIKLDLSITRLENILFGDDPAKVHLGLDSLRQNHGRILSYLSYVINIGNINDSGWDKRLMSYITSRQNVDVYRSTSEKYGDITGIKDSLENAWKHYMYYFPDAEVPLIYTCITGFNNSFIVGNDVVGISLDRYLGSESEYYSMLGIYNYQRLWMISDKIVSDCMYAWASSTWTNKEDDDNSLDLMKSMIHEGRLLYFTKCMVPEVEDTLLFRFSGIQMQFVLKNEQQMWEYLVEHDMLFSTDPLLIKKLTGDAPFTSYFTRESPGRAASWIGFRIVESYMRKNPGISLPDLMEEDNLPGILEKSKYSPG